MSRPPPARPHRPRVVTRRAVLRAAMAAPAALTLLGCGRKARGGPVQISYWEKWTKFEGKACADMVAAFNEKFKGRIAVELLTVSQIERKVLVAIAGGNPPDVAGVYAFCVCPYADRNALAPLDDLLNEAGIRRDDYVPAYWDMCRHRGRMWALPTTPATVALHWNKRLFREAGLDPERPPRSIQELDQLAEKLTRRAPDGSLAQVGYLPQEPGWWNWAWGFWFGGQLWNGKDTITADCPGNIDAFEWIASYSRKYGADNIRRFASGFGNFSSPQNAFLSGKVAMELQGVWMHNFIDMYAPGMEWAAAPFPRAETPAGLDPADPRQAVTIADADVIVIPRGSRHPKEAWEFIRFVNSQEGMEILCMGQRKFSPLAKVSSGFWEKHPHPYIKLFRDLAESPAAVYTPQTGVLREYQRELNNAFDRVRLGSAEPAQALGEVRERIQNSLDRELRRLLARGIINE